MRESAAGCNDIPKLVSDLLDGLQEPRTPYISTARFGELAALSQGTIARLAGVHRNTVRLNPALKPIQDRLREMIKIITSAVELTGDVEKAFFIMPPGTLVAYTVHVDLVVDCPAGPMKRPGLSLGLFGAVTGSTSPGSSVGCPRPGSWPTAS